jgi:short-subunit dehydrogenase
MSAERVARIGYRALTNGRHVVVAGLQNKLMVLALQLIAPLMRVLPPQALKWGGELLMGRTSS